MDTAAQILLKVLSKNNLENKLGKYQFVSQWTQIVGEEIARRTRPDAIRRKTLYVAVINSAWAQELSFIKESIIKKLHQHCPNHNQVNDIYFFVNEASFSES